MSETEQGGGGRRGLRPPRIGRRLGIVIIALVLAGVIAAAVSSLHLDKIGHALASAQPGWMLAALGVMMSSLFARSISWRQTIMAALPDTPIGQAAVTRATMIGVMGSAVFPGRLGEPSRVVVVSRRLDAPTRRMLPVVAGTVFSQTLINLLALTILAIVALTSVPLLRSRASALELVIGIPLLVVALVLVVPPLLRVAARSRWRRLRRGAIATRRLVHLARQGLTVFARPRHGLPAVTAQLVAWALQWLSCYLVLVGLHLQAQAGLDAAAAILLAVNVSAVVPATPSNVGVFQAACVGVLALYGVSYGPALAYGILLQAVEIMTALVLGIPALLGEGMTWQDIRRAGAAAQGGGEGSGEEGGDGGGGASGDGGGEEG